MASVKHSRMKRLYGKKGYRPQSVLNRPIGEVRLSRGRQEAKGVAFNDFPEIGDRLPAILADIVVETTEAVARAADDKVPVGETGALKASQQVRYTKARRTGQIVTGRIDYNPEDPPGSKHYYGFYVEVGTVKSRAQPFLVPAVMGERDEFNRKLRNLEDRL